MLRKTDVSVIIPVKNGESFLEETLGAILKQTAVDNGICIEVCVYDDASTDKTWIMLEKFELFFENRGISMKKMRREDSGGVGFAKNEAVKLSTGKFLCFNDADDVSDENRILKQYTLAMSLSSDLVFIGCDFHRLPENSTARYTKWANSMAPETLKTQVYTSHGPTLVAPTWFISRSLYDIVGKFEDSIKHGFPEDLEFFYRCLDERSCVFEKVSKDLVLYRYHPGCATFGVDEKSIWSLRLNRLRREYLSKWDRFTIWSAGKQGKRFFKSLSSEEKAKVAMFCDIDESKIKRGMHEEFDEKTRKITHRIPIVHILDAKPPFVVCVKLDLTGGDLEEIIEKQDWREDEHLVYFG